MKFQLAVLLLVSGLFPEVLSLVCQYSTLLPESVGSNSHEINCPKQCASLTIMVIKDGKNSTSIVKTCGVPELCATESLNLGEMQITSNAKCCNTTLCNIETLPALPQQQANGKMCYSCENNDCSRTVDCVGQENYCLSQTVNILDKTSTMKGCSYKSVCDSSTFLHLQGIGTVNVQCCQGNLCNGAESLTLSFLLTFIPLISSILF